MPNLRHASCWTVTTTVTQFQKARSVKGRRLNRRRNAVGHGNARQPSSYNAEYRASVSAWPGYFQHVLR